MAKNAVEVDGKFVGLLKTVRERLSDDPLSNMGALPRWMPNGEAVKTLAHVEAVTGYDRKAAALAVLQAKEAPAELRQEAKDVYAGAGAVSRSIGIGTRTRRTRLVERAHGIRKRKRKKNESKGLYPAWKDGEQYNDSICVMLTIVAPGAYAWPGGVPEKELHITALYYGDLKDYEGPWDEDAWIERLKMIADKYERYEAVRAGGITRFSSEDENGRDPVVLNISSPVVDSIRADLVREFGRGPSQFGYTPHMTLAYIDQSDPMPMQRFSPQPVLLDGIMLSWGPNDTHIPFREPTTKENEDA